MRLDKGEARNPKECDSRMNVKAASGAARGAEAIPRRGIVGLREHGHVRATRLSRVSRCRCIDLACNRYSLGAEVHVFVDVVGSSCGRWDKSGLGVGAQTGEELDERKSFGSQPTFFWPFFW